jgi:hypothetical protein
MSQTQNSEPGFGQRADDRNVRNALSVWGSQVGYNSLTIVVKEFWPDIRRKLFHKRQQDARAP